MTSFHAVVLVSLALPVATAIAMGAAYRWCA